MYFHVHIQLVCLNMLLTIINGTLPPAMPTVDPDITSMQALAVQLQHVLPTWLPWGDPCYDQTWEGVTCGNGGEVLTIEIPNVAIERKQSYRCV